MNDPFDLVHPPSSLSFYPFESRLISILHFRTFTATNATPSPAGNHFSNQIPFTLLSICCTPSLDAPFHGHFDVCTPRHYFSITIERKKGEYEWIQIREGLKKGKVVFFFPPMLPSKRLGGKKNTQHRTRFHSRTVHTHTHFYLHVRGSYTPRLLYSHFTWKYLIIYTFGLRLIDCMTSGLILYISFLFFLFIIISRTFGLVFFFSFFFFPHFLFCGGAVAVALRGIGQDRK